MKEKAAVMVAQAQFEKARCDANLATVRRVYERDPVAEGVLEVEEAKAWEAAGRAASELRAAYTALGVALDAMPKGAANG